MDAKNLSTCQILFVIKIWSSDKQYAFSIPEKLKLLCIIYRMNHTNGAYEAIEGTLFGS